MSLGDLSIVSILFVPIGVFGPTPMLAICVVVGAQKRALALVCETVGVAISAP